MAYEFYFDLGDELVKLPIAPEKLTLTINNKNDTVDLLNCGEYNILKSPGLTDISYDVLLPAHKLPSCEYINDKFRGPEYFLEIFERVKIDKLHPTFKVIRKINSNSYMYDTNMKVSLEKYKITEDWEEGFDVLVNIELKQYKELETVVINLKKEKGKVYSKTQNKKANKEKKDKTYIVKKGDNLWNICKQYYGNSSRCYEIAKYNNVKKADMIFPGQVIKFK